MKLISLSILLLITFPHWALAHGDLHLQIEEVTKRILQEPKNAELYLKRGELHRAHQEWDAAQADYDLAQAFNPGLKVVDLGRGKMFFEANWPLSAMVALNRFIAHYSNHVDALVTRARTLVKLGRRIEAAQDYSQAIASAAQPQPEMFLERAQALTAEGEAYIEQALKGIDEGINRLGPLVVLQLYAIDVEVKEKHFDSALGRLERVAAQSPRKETWLERRAEILQQAGRPREAIEAYQAALKALDTLPPSRRQVPAMIELEKRVRLALGSAGVPDK
jgi:tetratricopeptide (TPR) repeat protein